MQRDGHCGRRNDLASDCQDAVHLPDAFLKVVSLHRGHGRKEQVTDGVTAQARLSVAGETVLQQLAH